jgi:site-specific recombinase XerC
VRFHDLRHTYASHFMMSGGNILALQKLLGHYDVSVTMKYAHLAPDHLATEAARVSFEASANVKAKVVALAEHVAQPRSGVGP